MSFNATFLTAFTAEQRARLEWINNNLYRGGDIIETFKYRDWDRSWKTVDVRSNSAGMVAWVLGLAYKKKEPNAKGDTTYAVPMTQRPGYMPRGKLLKILGSFKFVETNERNKKMGDVIIVKTPEVHGYSDLLDAGFYYGRNPHWSEVLGQNGEDPFDFGIRGWPIDMIEKEGNEVAFYRRR
ncbi:hypothetical protein HNV12_03635 [Methanococcoides sp. SA1]|nr:hypothetical protein [Methanococcoides sp. SA1]